MTEIVLHEEAFDELREAFIGAGVLVDDSDMRRAEAFTVQDITYKLWEPPPLTPEQIERQKAFMATPLGQCVMSMFKRANERIAEDLLKDHAFIDGPQWPVGTQLRIRLPNDFKEPA